MFNMGNMGNLMKQAQAMQARMEKAQKEIAEHEVTGESGAGLVKVTMTGAREVKRVEIDDSVFGDDKEMCEDLLAAAINDAHRRVTDFAQDKMSSVTAGINLPPGVKLPF